MVKLSSQQTDSIALEMILPFLLQQLILNIETCICVFAHNTGMQARRQDLAAKGTKKQEGPHF